MRVGVLGRMRVGPLDLHEALGADGLVAAAGAVEVGRVEEEADGALGRVLVQIGLQGLPVDLRVLGQLHLARLHLRVRQASGRGREGRQGLGPAPEHRGGSGRGGGGGRKGEVGLRRRDARGGVGVGGLRAGGNGDGEGIGVRIARLLWR